MNPPTDDSIKNVILALVQHTQLTAPNFVSTPTTRGMRIIDNIKDSGRRAFRIHRDDLVPKYIQSRQLSQLIQEVVDQFPNVEFDSASLWFTFYLDKGASHEN